MVAIGNDLGFCSLLQHLGNEASGIARAETETPEFKASCGWGRDLLRGERFRAESVANQPLVCRRSGGPPAAIVLAPTTKSGPRTLPMLSPTFTYSEGRFTTLRLYLSLFFQNEGEVCALGYRFEKPEGDGTHDFYHAQLTPDLLANCGEIDQIALKKFHLDRMPAIPVDATSATELLLALLVGLYGGGYLASLNGKRLAGLEPSLKRFRALTSSSTTGGR